MPRTSTTARLAAVLPCILVLAAGCSGGPAAPPATQLPLTLVNGRTTVEARALALAGSGYTLTPLLSAGDQVPLLSGDWRAGTSDPANTYGVPTKFDGLGVYPSQGGYLLWCNHEVAEDLTTPFSTTVSGSFTGGRVSLFKFDAQWRCLGGRSLITSCADANGVYCNNTLSGSSFSQSWLASGAAEGKYCSAQLFDGYGGEPLFFPGEESGHGRAKVLYPDGRAVVLSATPVGSWENVVPLSACALQGQTVILLLDDSAPAYLFMYIGSRSAADPYGLLSGTTYVARLLVGGDFAANTFGLSSGSSGNIEWQALSSDFNCGAATSIAQRKALYKSCRDWCAASGQQRATSFVRIEDGEEDRLHPGVVYFNTTGRDSGGAESASNPDVLGRTWKLTLQPGGVLAGATLQVLATGAAGSFISPDNTEISAGRWLFVQEDVNSGAPAATMSADLRANSIWLGDLLSGQWTRRFRVNQNDAQGLELPQSAGATWETSGITDLGVTSGGLPALLFDVQCHGLTQTLVGGKDYGEAGQLLLAQPQ